MAAAEEPVLSRLDRIDIILKQLEEMKGANCNSPKSSTASTPSSGIPTSDDFSPKSMEKHCRPIEDVILESETKGTLIERLVQVEDRLLKLEVESHEKKKKPVSSADKSSRRKSLKQLVKSCVKGKRNHKSKY